ASQGPMWAAVYLQCARSHIRMQFKRKPPLGELVPFSTALTALLLVLVPATVFGAPLLSAGQLRSCVSIEDGTKERLDWFDAIVPPEAMPGTPKAQTVLECRFLKEEDQRLACFNSFVAGRTAGTGTPSKAVGQAGGGTRSVRPSAERKPTTDLKLKIDVVT